MSQLKTNKLYPPPIFSRRFLRYKICVFLLFCAASALVAAAAASEFEFTATSVTVDNQFNISSAAYFGALTTQPPSPSASQIDEDGQPLSGGLYFNGTGYYLYEGGGWQGPIATGTVGGLDWAQSGNNIYNTNGGNVGIGTTSPAQMLSVGSGSPFTVTSAGAVTDAGETVNGNVTASGIFLDDSAGNPGGNGYNMPYVGSGPNYGPGVRWTDGTTANTMGLYVDYGLVFQGNSNDPALMVYSETGTGSLGTQVVHLGGASATDNSWFDGGNVGIGTTSPGATLDVEGSVVSVDNTLDDGSGNASFAGNVDIGGEDDDEQLCLNGACESSWPSGGVANGGLAANYDAIYNGSALTQGLLYESGGNVGIGTTSPGATLDVEGSVNVHSAIYNDTGADLYISGGTSGYTDFSGGNVGIGTTSPGYLLDVAGSIHAGSNGNDVALNYDPGEGGIIRFGSSSGTQYFVENVNGVLRGVNSPWNLQLWSFDQSGNFTTDGTATIGGAVTDEGETVNGIFTSDGGQIYSNGSGGLYADYLYGNGAGITGLSAGALPAGSAAGDTPYWNGSAWVMTSNNLYNDGGNVGIGTTSPDQLFTVYGGSIDIKGSGSGNPDIVLSRSDAGAWFHITNINNTLQFTNGITPGYAPVVITNFGAVGIGTTSPPQMLSVGSGSPFTVTSAGTVTDAGETVNGNITLDNGASNTIFYGDSGIAAPGNGSAGEKIQLFGAAGTVSASDYALGIQNGNMWFNTDSGYMWYLNGAASPEMVLTSGGNVGIGTTSPGATLDVEAPNETAYNTQLIVGQGSGNQYDIGRISDSGFLSIQGTQTGYDSILLAPSSGNVGIGTTSPAQMLSVGSGSPFTVTSAGAVTDAGETVNGNITGAFALSPSYNAWNALVAGAGGAQITNDGGTYKTLMIVGNTSGGGAREVGIWDDLTVNSNLTVDGIFTSDGGQIYSNGSGGLYADYLYGNGAGITGLSAGALPAGSAAGDTPYWNGSAWVMTSNNLYNDGGNVGIGTTSPGATLSVAGTTSQTEAGVTCTTSFQNIALPDDAYYYLNIPVSETDFQLSMDITAYQGPSLTSSYAGSWLIGGDMCATSGTAILARGTPSANGEEGIQVSPITACPSGASEVQFTLLSIEGSGTAYARYTLCQ